MEKVFLIPDESIVDSQKSPKAAPFIDYLVDYLFNKYRKNDFWDMSKVLLVVPSARVRIETLEQILIRAEKENVLWEIPKIVTIGRALEYFYRQTRPLADDVTQFLAWGKAVETSDKNKRSRFFPVIPDKNDLTKRILFGQMLGGLHENLAAESLSFADVAQKLKDLSVNSGRLNLQNEIDRWNFLSEVEESYLSILDKLNLWDRHAARRYALDSPQEGRNGFPGDFEIDLDIILAGIVDLNKIQKEMLRRVEEHVTALIYAPESESEGFDEFGALKVEFWSSDLSCPLSEDKIIQVDKPEEQVLCAFDFIRQLSEDYSPDDFVIGAPDEKLIPFVESTADKLGLEIDNTIGISLSSTSPGALLTAIAEFLELHDFESFASLVRHPEVYDAIYNASDEDGKIIPDKSIEIISILDSYQQNNFPLDVSSGFLSNPFNEEQGIIKRVLNWINEWLSELNQKEIDPQKLKQIVTNIFDHLPKDQYVLNRNAQRMLSNIAGKLELIPKSLTGKLTPVSALKLLLLRSNTYTLPNGSEEDGVEEDESQESDASSASKPMIHLAGWLELVWDRSPVLAILSFNEGVVPQSVNAHLFLPNELRKALGIMHNDRRFARDAYALKAMSSSKQEIRAIFGKRDTEGKPALPSRLLFNKGEENDNMATFAAQAFRFFNEKQPLPKYFLEEPGLQESESLNEYIKWAKNNLSGGALKGVVSEVSVTNLRDYIQCPFRFYLKHVLKVQPTDYAVKELTSLSYGTFIHNVLQEWAQKELKNGRTDWRIPADELSEVLSDIVDKIYHRSYPDSVLPGIAIQKEIIKQRLKSFAELQSTLEGEIITVEHPFEQVVYFNNSKNDAITLKGKFDRIDRMSDGTIILLDYKTGRKKDPSDDHIDKNKKQKQGEDNNHLKWINLQLPVYRQIILANREKFDWMTPDTDVQVGYITIPDDENASLINPCKQPGSRSKKTVWDDKVFSDAEKYTSEILTNIYNGVFWPPTPTKEIEHDNYADFVSWLERNQDDWE
ncbi:MAG: PD-(D/E)XK nuclease family protein [Thermoguttaceae bacterium]|nr:PD-(D/E)XK nuclease family protein [Thermoguttaceae bacterium]